MRYIKPQKLKVMLAAFLGTGIFGIYLGLAENYFYLVTLGVINLCLGGLVGWILLTQKPRTKRRKKP